MFDVYSSVNIIFINFDKYLKFDISYIVTLVWPPKRLRNQKVVHHWFISINMLLPSTSSGVKFVKFSLMTHPY